MKNLAAIPPKDLQAKDILAIPVAQPEQLFEPDAAAIRLRYRELAKLWHPDVTSDPKAGSVIDHISLLKKSAEEKLKRGAWQKPGEIRFVQIGTGAAATLQYVKKHDFELGEIYISTNYVTYTVKKDFRDLFDNARQLIENLKFANDEMKKECRRYLPVIHKTMETADRLVMVVKKDPNMVLLSDVCGHFGGKMDPKHAAWVLSRLHNIACYLSYAGLAHNAIALQNCFIDPQSHTVALLGGWWYAAKSGQPLKGLPQLTLDVAPDLARSGRADMRTDLMLIRAAGRALLGDAIGMRLTRDKDVPRPMADWLTLPPGDDARTDYHKWMNTILPNSFGARRFVEMKIKPGDIYQP